jgi:predicted Rossmann-fold nucleotide-binding protein
MPGGMGTLDEFFEAVTLVQTNKIKRFPIVLFGKEYHKHLYKHIQYMAEAGTISPKDLELFLFTDDIHEMEAHLTKYAVDAFGLKKVTKPKRWLIFGE